MTKHPAAPPLDIPPLSQGERIRAEQAMHAYAAFVGVAPSSVTRGNMITLELTTEEATRLLDYIIPTMPDVAERLSDAIGGPVTFLLRYQTDNGYMCSCCLQTADHEQEFADIGKLCIFVAERELMQDGDYGFRATNIVRKRSDERSLFSEFGTLLDTTRGEAKRRLDLQVQILKLQSEIETIEGSLRYAKSEFEGMKHKLNEVGIAQELDHISLTENKLSELQSKLTATPSPGLSEELMRVAHKIADESAI